MSCRSGTRDNPTMPPDGDHRGRWDLRAGRGVRAAQARRRRCSCSRPRPGAGQSQGWRGSSGSRTVTSGCARWRSRRARAGGAGSASSAAPARRGRVVVSTDNGDVAAGRGRAARPRRDPPRAAPRADHPYDTASGTRWPGACACERAIAALAARVRGRRAPSRDRSRRPSIGETRGRRRGSSAPASARSALIDPLGLDLQMTSEPHSAHLPRHSAPA